MNTSRLALATLAYSLTIYSQAQTFEWGKQIGGSNYDYATAIAVDGSDNVYSTGQFQSTADFDPGPGVYDLTTTTAYQVFVSKLDAQGDFVWAVELGGPQSDYPNDIATDPSENVVVCGTFNVTADMDPGPSTYNLTSVGSSDVFVCKLDPDGNFIWAVSVGSISYDYPASLDVDVYGNIYLTGVFRDTVDFDPGPGVQQRIANGYDGFLLQLLPDGSFADVWIFGGSGDVSPNCVEVDDAGNKYVTGSYNGVVDLDPGPAVLNGTQNVEIGALFISKLDPNGDLLWANAGDDQIQAYGHSIAVDDFGNVYVAGQFYGTVDFDAGPASFVLIAEYGYNMFLTKLGPTGVHQWTRDRGELDADHSGNSIDVDLQNNAYIYDVITRYNGGAFQSIAQQERQGQQPNYLSIQKWNPSGTLEFDYELGPSAQGSRDSPHALFVTSDGNIHAAANFTYETLDVDPGPGVSELTPFGNLDVLIHKMSQCPTTFNSITASACEAYTVPSGDETYTISGTIQDTLVNACGGDSILTIDLTINYNTVGSETMTACDSMTWAANGVTYTTSGTYFSMLINAAGCDSLATLDLTVNYSSTSTDTQIACDSFLWDVDGNTYDTSGSYTALLTNAAGCDSTITLDLTVNYSTTSTDVQEACDSFFWDEDGNTYDTSGNYTALLTNAAGCDSTITLDLTINNSNTSADVQVACDSFLWDVDGNTYDTSGSYTAILTNTAGCDSTITLDLTVNYSTASTDVEVACESFFWDEDGNTYDTSGSYTAMLTNAAGCDSTVTLDLTINNSNTSADVQVACDSFFWDADGNTYDTSGSYTTILTNAAGCDSTITLDLTINNSNASADVQEACDSFFWDADGNTYDTSGSYTAILTNAAGCDSTITLDLTINNSNASADIQEACDSFFWDADGNNYDTSGSYTTILTNAAGCDSTITLDLTINNSNTSADVQVACDSFFWDADGNTYDSSGSYTALLTNAAGCDSIITLDLTVNYSTASTVVEVACDSFLWDVDGNTYDTTGSYTAVLTNAVGCDSTITLDLTVNSNITSVDVQVACDSFFWDADGNTYDTDGSYTAILTNAAGCDSTVTLDLTVNSSSTGAQVEVACDSFLWDADGNTYDNSGSYTAILTNAAGCDSTITLDLSILNSSASSTSVNTCTDYFWDADGNTYDSSGTYSAVFINAVGCDSTATLLLTVDTVDVTVITIADTAFTASATNAVFQWLDCDNNNEPIPGATSADFAPTNAGSYAVEVTQNGCTDTSACSISTVGIDYLNNAANVVVFPNPTDGQLNIVFGKVQANVFITVHAMDGRQVAAFKEKQTDRIVTELDVAQGNYLIHVFTEGAPPAVFKVLVQ
ncbi:MAG: SBBP repeat-containing protein [Flavobacteriales bacterium]|nr:SBBP repeat-containing protein [Flavobacteriales bacterium]MBK7296381.1 SBBP repeat-containing protein [Flavobacteriales bacterium]MBK9534931.1 SBBP repeat-containing protein [Flavobacteriales bacterium]MBP9138499.1 SBBP repeat-containing protein [Flavobacteriales bacterium]HQX28964.1 SBBP repeat-containing protein [Flavobacteriales bacterium]